MILKGFFAELNFDTRGAESAIDDAMKRELFKAWDAWVTEFIRVVPVWSGQSVGTILPLAEIIGRTVTIDAPQGHARSNQSSIGAAQSSAVVEHEKGKWTITYETALQHLIINEFFDATVWGFNLHHPGPYSFQEKCVAKFKEAAAQARLPDLSRFFDFDKRSF